MQMWNSGICMKSASTKTLIKICGVTSPTDAEAISTAGVDMLGLNFYAHSPRCIAPACAVEIAAVATQQKLVGVFVNPDVADVHAVLDKVPLDILQFHGSEAATLCAEFGKPYIKAVGMAPGFDFRLFASRYSEACAYLLDADDPQQHGGTGRVFDWQQWPQSTTPLILSGGLNPDNVGAAVAQLQPWAVDVASGVEGDVRGRKDPQRIAAFVHAVRSA